jgi:hypothetical protein
VLDARLSRRGAGERVAVRLVTPADWNGAIVCLVSARGRAALGGALAADLDGGGATNGHGRGGRALVDAERVLARGAAVLALDPLLAGATPGERLPVDGGWHERYAGFTWGYNRTLLAQRVHDVLTAVAFARARPGARAVHLAGGDPSPEGGGSPAGAWAVLAAAQAGAAVERTAVDWGWDFDAVTGLDDPDLLPGAARYGGVVGFATLLAPRPLALAGARAVPAELESAWHAAEAAEPCAAIETAGILDWLLGERAAR